jgi:hypothetical protein
MLTRRRLLELGAGAWLAAMLGAVTTAPASEANFTAPRYLRRASWVPLIGTTAAAGGVTLRLTEVADLPHLVARDDAFALELTGPAGALSAGIHQLRHPALGTFTLFVSPVDTVAGGVQHYEIVVDRSVGVPRSVPTAPRRKARQAKIAS